MLQSNELVIKGDLEIILKDAYGAIKLKKLTKNMVVTSGRNFIASRIIGTPAVMSHMAIGTNNTAVVAGHTALLTEIARVAVAAPTVSTNVVTFSATFAAGVGTGALVEAGIFNAASAGTMLARSVFGVINKAAADSLTINWTIST